MEDSTTGKDEYEWPPCTIVLGSDCNIEEHFYDTGAK